MGLLQKPVSIISNVDNEFVFTQDCVVSSKQIKVQQMSMLYKQFYFQRASFLESD